MSCTSKSYCDFPILFGESNQSGAWLLPNCFWRVSHCTLTLLCRLIADRKNTARRSNSKSCLNVLEIILSRQRRFALRWRRCRADLLRHSLCKALADARNRYTYAIECDPNNHVFYTNRAACYATMGEWEKVLRDAQRSIDRKSDWVKVGAALIFRIIFYAFALIVIF